MAHYYQQDVARDLNSRDYWKDGVHFTAVRYRLYVSYELETGEFSSEEIPFGHYHIWQE
jgi:hypothetical protein